MLNMQKERKKESKKLNEIFEFIKMLISKKNLKLSEKQFNKELILFFNITDFRVVASKTKLMETLDLIEKHLIKWGDYEIWIKGKP